MHFTAGLPLRFFADIVDANEWQCPCHGSRFGTDGHVVGGPAGRPLATPPAHVEGDALVIDLDGLTG